LPRTTVARTTTNLTGIDLATQAADMVNGMQFQNNGNQSLFVDNLGISSISVTIDFAPDRFNRDGSKVVAVPAGEQKFIGPFIPELYNQGGYVHVDFSDDTSVTVGVLSLQS
jgi:hypothetical protein